MEEVKSSFAGEDASHQTAAAEAEQSQCMQAALGIPIAIHPYSPLPTNTTDKQEALQHTAEGWTLSCHTFSNFLFLNQLHGQEQREWARHSCFNRCGATPIFAQQ